MCVHHYLRFTCDSAGEDGGGLKGAKGIDKEIVKFTNDLIRKVRAALTIGL